MVIAAVNLRAGIASVGPVLGEALEALGTGSSAAGLITAMPCAFFAIMGFAAVPIAQRLGVGGTLLAGMVACLVGLAVRPWVGSFWWFLPLTALVVSGIAVANVLLPAWIKQHGGTRIVALMAVYGTFLGVSGAVGPLSYLWFSGQDRWRWALLVWVIPAFLQVVVWAPMVVRLGRDTPSGGQPHPQGHDAEAVESGGTTAAGVAGAAAGMSMWRSRSAVLLALFFGLQSSGAYIQMGWLPSMYQDAGVSGETASTALAIIGVCGALGGLIMPGVIARVTRLEYLAAFFGLLTLLGWMALLVAPGACPLGWACVLGVGGFCFPTAIALIPDRTKDPATTARLSGFVQPYGYLLAALGPFLVGVMHDATGSWSVVLFFLIAMAAVMVVVGFLVGRGRIIDDELTEKAASLS